MLDLEEVAHPGEVSRPCAVWSVSAQEGLEISAAAVKDRLKVRDRPAAAHNRVMLAAMLDAVEQVVNHDTLTTTTRVDSRRPPACLGSPTEIDARSSQYAGHCWVPRSAVPAIRDLTLSRCHAAEATSTAKINIRVSR